MGCLSGTYCSESLRTAELNRPDDDIIHNPSLQAKTNTCVQTLGITITT